MYFSSSNGYMVCAACCDDSGEFFEILPFELGIFESTFSILLPLDLTWNTLVVNTRSLMLRGAWESHQQSFELWRQTRLLRILHCCMKMVKSSEVAGFVKMVQAKEVRSAQTLRVPNYFRSSLVFETKSILRM